MLIIPNKGFHEFLLTMLLRSLACILDWCMLPQLHERKTRESLEINILEKKAKYDKIIKVLNRVDLRDVSFLIRKTLHCNFISFQMSSTRAGELSQEK